MTEPLPWWLGFLVRAEAWHIPPWELFDVKTRKTFWMQCATLLDNARHTAREKQERDQEAAIKKAGNR